MKTASQSGSGSQRTRARVLPLGRFQRKIDFLLAAFQLAQNFFAIGAQNILKQIQLGLGVQTLCLECILCVQVCEQDLSASVRDQQRAIEGVQQAGDELKAGLAARLLLRCHRLRQFGLPGRAKREKTPLS